jgi:hypothetical protein
VIQREPALLNYVNAWLHPAHRKPGGFLEAFLNACIRASPDNWMLIRPALLVIMLKYPADPEILAIEEHDNPGSDEEEDHDENSQK